MNFIYNCLFSFLLANEDVSIQASGLKDQYIVVLKPNQKEVNDHIEYFTKSARLYGGSIYEIGHIYDSDVIKGYSGKFDKNTIDHIKSLPEVDYVEKDSIMKTSEVQDGAPWGLVRSSSQNKVTGKTGNYTYDVKAGEDVNVYVIDTGVNILHKDFEGRAKWGISTAGGSNTDGNGHGTHVAGTIAGKTYGIAKKAMLYAVKVLGDNGSGSTSGVIKGIEWAANHAKTNGGKRGNVANMSLGGGFSSALNQAIKAGSKYLTYVVAAGNENQDACNVSPASEPSAITVAASTIDDTKASFSNHGKCVDVIAPGKDIMSAWIGSDSATKTISGTSMASPHVAGIVAYYLSTSKEIISLANVSAVLSKHSLSGKISGFNTLTPNLLVNNQSIL